MNNKQIKCPKCDTYFKLDESQYSLIVDQVRTNEFNEQLEKNKKEIARAYQEKLENALENNKLQNRNEVSQIEANFKNIFQQKENQIIELEAKIEVLNSQKEEVEKSISTKVELVKSNLNNEFSKKEQEKDKEIVNLISKINFLYKEIENIKYSQEDKIAVEKANVEKNKEIEISKLKLQIQSLESEKVVLANKYSNNLENERKNLLFKLREQEQEIEKLKKQNEDNEELSNLKEEKAIRQKSDELTKQFIQKEELFTQKINELQREKDNIQNEYNLLKDFKSKQSVKLLGESLEQHCENEFIEKRSLGLFRNAIFMKDNDASNGSKGDFIFKDFEDGIEYLSIMFEMKNESENSNEKNKKKNSHFYEKLHKDRVAKNCEYAVLVSMLEQENETFNNGIVDVSTNEFPKMYVIRPQFFISLISILKNAALNSVSYKKQIEETKKHNIDLSTFEGNLNEFKEGFGKNINLANKNFEASLKDIDKAIKSLLDLKESIEKTGNNLRIANNKVQEVSVKKLTKNCEALREQMIEKK